MGRYLMLDGETLIHFKSKSLWCLRAIYREVFSSGCTVFQTSVKTERKQGHYEDKHQNRSNQTTACLFKF